MFSFFEYDNIEEWGNEDKSSNNYIFPILNNAMTAMEEYSRVRTLTRFLNEAMTTVLEDLQIGKKINNKICRKSLATILKREGASTEFIQDTLGHMNKSTTEYYMEDYEDEVKKNFSIMMSWF